MKLKKITAALLAGVMCVGLLAGCGSKGDGNKEDSGDKITIRLLTRMAGTTPQVDIYNDILDEFKEKHPEVTIVDDSQGDDSGDKITIRLLTRMAGTTPQVDIYNDILDEFKEKHPEVTIVDDSQGDESAFNNILSTDIASGTMANIFRIQGVANLSEYIDNGLILDVQPYLDEDPEWGGGFTEGALSYYQVPGKEGTYAIPMESGLIGVYYNKDLFDKAGVKEFPGGFTEGALSYYQVPGKEGTYAIPMESGLIGVYYNKDLFDKAGVKEFPETWTEFLDAIKKLKDSGVIPIAMGTQTTYMAGHLHDQIFYKWLGTDAAKKLGSRDMKWTDPEVVETLQFVQDLIDAGAFDKNAAGFYKWLGTDAAKKLGSRDMKWTDPEVVETLQFVQDLIDAGAFDKNAAGMTDNIAMTQFQQGEAAMVITGPWNIGTFEDPAETPVCDSIEVAKFPYFEEKPEFKNEDMQTLSPYMISGKLEGKELELTLELVKMLTDKEAAKRFAEEAAFLIPRTDIELDDSVTSPLFAKNVELGGTSEGIGVDVFDFDPLSSMQDRTRNSISSMFTGEKPEDVAKEIQSEIDK